jgi:hypothetical protein
MIMMMIMVLWHLEEDVCCSGVVLLALLQIHFGFRCHVNWLVEANISEKCAVSIFRA